MSKRTSMSNSNLFTASFISSILSIVSSSIVPGMTSLMLSAFNAVLNLCKNQNNASTRWSVSQSNASVTFNFAQTLWNHSNIEFDSAPITVKFGIGASQTGTYSFTGYSSMSFFVLIAHPEANTSTTLYIYLPEESMSISSFYIDNSD